MTEIGRNDPCPCGSGKKYKKCCGAKQAGRIMNAVNLTSCTAAKMNSFFQSKIAESGERSEKAAIKVSKPDQAKGEEKKNDDPQEGA
jgi:hypothetical protein